MGFVNCAIFLFEALKLGLLALCMSLISLTATAQIAITEIQPIKFPTVLQNSGSSTTVVVNRKGAIGNATNSTLLDNDYYQGRYFITSDGTAPIDINF